MLRVLALLFFAALSGATFAADDWVNMLAADPTGGLVTGHVCYTTNGRDISCDAGAPTITSGTLYVATSISSTNGYFGTVSATSYYGDGSHLIGVGAGDRIVSGSLLAVANSATGYISLTTGVTNWGYFSSGQSFIPSLGANTVSSALVSTTNVSVTLSHYTLQPFAAMAGGGGNYIVSSTTSVSASNVGGGSIKFATGSGLAMTISGTGVGILEATPGGRFAVSGTAGPSYETVFGLGATGDIYLRAGAAAGKIVLGDQNTGNVELGSVGSYAVVNGKLGIGTSTPSEKLEIASGGNIKMGYELITNNCSSASSCVATCSAGKQALGGGCVRISAGAIHLLDSQAAATTYTCNWDATGTTVQAQVVCANIK